MSPRLLNNHDYADIIATVGKGDAKQYYLHQTIVRPNSTYFTEACKKPADQAGFKYLTLPNVQTFSFDIAIRWIYGDKDIIKNKNQVIEKFYSVLNTAKMLCLEYLRVAVQKVNLADKAIVAKKLKAAGDVEGFWDVI
ncbi:hypothetical protein TWF106_007406 [Orbilia oligospora]|uniref:BTB domain-containing protein n=1 Tax=Orbilia oligospora TaxID=2813651 RepID=A0A7C8QWW5_ORBOL|nr:hypothetical protein TWF106_007406 [Orbilia oligospora]